MQDQALAGHVGAPARQQLATLRRALDERLSALEAALSGSRADVPLETLVLDLARVATDEALAATELACADAQAESDAALQRLTALEQTRNLERRQLEERVAALSKANADSVAACEALAMELAGVRAGASEHERAHRALQQHVEGWQAEKEAEQAAQKAEKNDMQQMLVSVKAVFMRFGQQKLAIDERFRTLEAELERTRAALTECATRARP
jgi:chromosome segregation ATPase